MHWDLDLEDGIELTKPQAAAIGFGQKVGWETLLGEPLRSLFRTG